MSGNKPGGWLRHLRAWWSDHRAVAQERIATLEQRARDTISLGEAQRLAAEAEALRSGPTGGARRKGVVPLFRN